MNSFQFIRIKIIQKDLRAQNENFKVCSQSRLEPDPTHLGRSRLRDLGLPESQHRFCIQRFQLDNFYLFIGPLASVVYEDPVSLRGSTDNKTKMSKELLQKIFLGK